MIPQGMLYGARAGGFSDGGQFRNRSAEQYNTQSGNPYLPIFNTSPNLMRDNRKYPQPVGLQQALQGMQINGGPMQQQQAMPVGLQQVLQGMPINGGPAQLPPQQLQGQPVMPQLARPVSGAWGRNVVMPAQHGFYGGWRNIRAMLAQQDGGYA